MIRQTLLGWGEPLPFFEAQTPFNPAYKFSSLGGYFSVIIVLPPLASEALATLLNDLKQTQLSRKSNHPVVFGLSNEAAVLTEKRVLAAFPHDRVFLDRDNSILARLGALDGEGRARPHWLMVDPDLRVYAKGSLRQIDRLATLIGRLPDTEVHAGQPRHAPVLVMPRILDTDFCDQLIAHYKEGHIKRSGFMVQENGRTVGKLDDSFKRRFDVDITDQNMRLHLSDRLRSALFPQIEKAFNFRPTRIERYIVACYRGDEQGFFSAHRDNTTLGTAHRRFAVTINLNDDYDGGGVSFPEFGKTVYHAPKGGAVVFGCSLLHQAERVTRGERFATLPFLYDEAAREVRMQNHKYLDQSKSGYRALKAETKESQAAQ